MNTTTTTPASSTMTAAEAARRLAAASASGDEFAIRHYSLAAAFHAAAEARGLFQARAVAMVDCEKARSTAYADADFSNCGGGDSFLVLKSEAACECAASLYAIALENLSACNRDLIDTRARLAAARAEEQDSALARIDG